MCADQKERAMVHSLGDAASSFVLRVEGHTGFGFANHRATLKQSNSSFEQKMVMQYSSSRLLKKGSECFESLSMNGKSSMISNPSVRPEHRRRTPTEFFSSLLGNTGLLVSRCPDTMMLVARDARRPEPLSTRRQNSRLSAV